MFRFKRSQKFIIHNLSHVKLLCVCENFNLASIEISYLYYFRNKIFSSELIYFNNINNNLLLPYDTANGNYVWLHPFAEKTAKVIRKQPKAESI